MAGSSCSIRLPPRAIEWTAERISRPAAWSRFQPIPSMASRLLAHPEALAPNLRDQGTSRDRMPLPVLVSSVDALSHLVTLDDAVIPLLDAFWPGPLTVVLPAASRVPDARAGTGATRSACALPNHPIAIEVIEKAGGAIACTSANRTGEAAGTLARKRGASIGGQLDLDSRRRPGSGRSRLDRRSDRWTSPCDSFAKEPFPWRRLSAYGTRFASKRDAR